MAAPVIVVDCECSGFDPRVHQVIEVAWWNLNTDERGCFIPVHDPTNVIAVAHPEALKVNRYIDRIATAPQDFDGSELARLHSRLSGDSLYYRAVMVGSNPKFDARFLAPLFGRAGLCGDPWGALWDLSVEVGRLFGLDMSRRPGLTRICELLGVEPGDHTAAGDVQATGLCFRELARRLS